MFSCGGHDGFVRTAKHKRRLVNLTSYNSSLKNVPKDAVCSDTSRNIEKVERGIGSAGNREDIGVSDKDMGPWGQGILNYLPKFVKPSTEGEGGGKGDTKGKDKAQEDK